jgi:hypothetical protein
MASKLDPPPKNGEEKKLYLPMSFWSQIVETLDQKTSSISQIYGYGKISMSFVVFNGKVKDIVFNDEVRIRPEWDKAPLNKNENIDSL